MQVYCLLVADYRMGLFSIPVVWHLLLHHLPQYLDHLKFN